MNELSDGPEQQIPGGPDIVGRLRSHVAPFVRQEFMGPLLSEAADEIEKLRAELDEWKKTVHYLRNMEIPR